jgi:teichuronic acid biosynthesis glycosyltransferase TuaG
MGVPSVSVIIPVYNGEKYLAQAVLSAIDQTGVPKEILIVDDCSSDRSRQIADELAKEHGDITVFHNSENMGVAYSRNRATQKAQGEYLALLDSDDRWLPCKLERQLALMIGNNLDLCYTGYCFIDQSGARTGDVYPVPEEITLSGLLNENVIGCSTVMMRASVAKQTPMRGDYAHEDYVLWLELLRKGCRFGGLQEATVEYRLTPQSRSAGKLRAAANRWRIYRSFMGMSAMASSYRMANYAFNAWRKETLKSLNPLA